MSLWSDHPEYFDEWIEKRALAGQLGPGLQLAVERGEVAGYEIWAMKEVDPKGELGSRAMQDYCERFVP